MTNNGHDWAYGAGVRVGWIGEVHPRLSLGAAVASKVYMTEFDDYDELFAEDGKFDIPANFTVGLTFKATPDLNLSFDFQRIYYEGVNSISNAGPIFVPGVGPSIPPGGGLLGTDDGLGFGWENINVYRLAADYRYNNEWNFRAGYSYNDQPIPDDQLLFNILAPATPKVHATVGFTYRPSNKSEWNFSYMHAFEEKVSSSQTAFGVPGEIKMRQNAVDLSLFIPVLNAINASLKKGHRMMAFFLPKCLVNTTLQERIASAIKLAAEIADAIRSYGNPPRFFISGVIPSPAAWRVCVAGCGGAC